MFHYVYVLQSVPRNILYIGYTTDVKRRILEHNRGLTFSTKPYVPWKCIHYEMYVHERDAKRREKYLKTNQGSRLLKLMLREYFSERK